MPVPAASLGQGGSAVASGSRIVASPYELVCGASSSPLSDPGLDRERRAPAAEAVRPAVCRTHLRFLGFGAATPAATPAGLPGGAPAGAGPAASAGRAPCEVTRSPARGRLRADRGSAPRGRAHWGHEHVLPGPARRTVLAAQAGVPQSLAVYDDYAAAQKAVDFLSDNKFPVEHCMIVGTDLKRIERITGRLTTGRVALGGLLSGIWLGIFVGLIFALFTEEASSASARRPSLFGALFGVIWALLGYAMTRGQRDFSSVTQVVATKYEVLVEHKVAAQARELLASSPAPRPTRSRSTRGERPGRLRPSDCSVRRRTRAPHRARRGSGR